MKTYLAILWCLAVVWSGASLVIAAPQAAPSSVVVKRFSEIPVEMATGEFIQREAPDLRVKSRGLMLEVTRNYRSRRETSGAFGYGWGWNHAERLEFPGDFVIHYVTPDGAIAIMPDVSYTSAYARVCVSAPSWDQGNKATGAPDAIGGYGNVAHYYGAIASLQPLVMGGWGFTPPDGPSTIIQVDLTSIGASAYDSDHPQYGISLKLSAGGTNSVGWGHKAYDFDYVTITGDRASWTWADVNAVQARLALSTYIQNIPMDVIADAFHLGVTYTRNTDGEFKYLPGTTFELVKTNNEYWINNKNLTRLAFALDGRLLRKSDASGNVLSYRYDGAGRLAVIADDLRQSITFAYENGQPDARVVRVEDHLGRSVGYAYLGEDLVAVTNVSGYVTRYEYAAGEGTEDCRHNLTRRIDPEGNSATVSYHTTNSTPDRVRCYRDGELAEGLTNEVDYLYLKGTTYSWRPGSGSIQGVVYNASNDISQVYIREGELTYLESDGVNLMAQHHAIRVSSPLTSVWQNIEAAVEGPDSEMAHNPALGTNSYLDASGWEFTVPGMSNDIVQVILSVQGLATNPVCLSVAGIAATNWMATNSTWVAFDISRAKGQWTWADMSNLVARVTLPAGVTNPVPVWIGGFRLKVTYRHFDPGYDPQDLLYFYDLAHNLVSSDRGGCAHQFAYDERGNLVAWTDPENNKRRYDYDPVFNKPVRTWDALGRVTMMEYDLAGRLARTVDALGHANTISYDRYGNVVRTVDASGAVEETTYDTAGCNVVKSRDRRGFETNYDYDIYGNCTRITAPDGGRRHAVFNAGGLKLSERDEAGVETRYDYDRNGQLTNIISAAGLLEESVVGRQVDRRGLEVARVDPFGRVERVELDADGRPVGQTDRMGRQTMTEYDENGNPWRMTDALGQTRETLRDERGNIVVSMDRLGNSESVGYDRNNNPVSALDRAGNRVTSRYDANGNKSSETYHWAGYPGCPESARPEAIRIDYFYDELNRVTNKVVGAGRRDAQTTGTRYNAEDEVIYEIDSVGNSRSNEYDEAGNVTNTCLRDTAGKVVEWESAIYDSGNRRVMEVKGGLVTNRFEYDLRGLKTAAIDSLGRRTTFTYDSHRRLIATTDPGGTTHRVAYDLCGNKVREVSGAGVVTGYEWDAAGRMTRKISGVGLPDSRVGSYDYDSLGRLVGVSNPLGHKIFTAYDAEGRVIGETNALGFARSYAYDAAGRVTNTVDEMGFQLAQWLDGRGKLCKLRDKRGGVTTSSYDAYGRLVRMTDTLGYGVTLGYDACDNKIQETDARGLVTRYEYDAASRVIRKVAGAGLPGAICSSTVYDAIGRAIGSAVGGISNSAPARVGYLFDAVGNTVAFTDACGAVTCQVYDNLGRQIASRDGLGGVRQTQYDAQGNVVTRIDPLGGVTRFSYDAYGLKRTQTDTAGAVTRYEYDQLGRLTNTIDALGGRESRQVDACNNLVSATAKNGAVTRFEYDPLGRLTNTLDACGNRSCKTYDADGRVCVETDGRSNQTTYVYDALGRVVVVTDASSNTLLFAYDSGGNKVREVLPSGLVVTHGYNGLGHEIIKTLGAGRGDSRSIRYEVDYAGRIVAEWGALGQVVRTSYDANGNKTNVMDPRGYQTQFRYDARNRPIRTTDALGHSADVEYDAMGRIVRTSNRRGAETLHRYDSEGRLTFLRDAEGNSKSNRYDRLGRLVEEFEPNGLVVRLSYDSAGQLTNRTSQAPDGERRSESFQYDLLGRKVRACNTMGLATHYVRDANGNVVAESVYNPGGTILRSRSTHYNSRNQPVLEVDYQGAVWRTDYDAMGRKVAAIDPLGHTTTYEWNVYNELIASTDPGGYRSTMSYDLAGRETERVNALGQRTRTLYDASGNKTAVIDDNGRAILTQYDPLNRIQTINRSMPDATSDMLRRADVNGDGQVDEADVTALEGGLQ